MMKNREIKFPVMEGVVAELDGEEEDEFLCNECFKV